MRDTKNKRQPPINDDRGQRHAIRPVFLNVSCVARPLAAARLLPSVVRALGNQGRGDGFLRETTGRLLVKLDAEDQLILETAAAVGRISLMSLK
jgi:hypothetical protein